MEATTLDFEGNAHVALENPALQSALAKIKTGWVANRARAADRLPEFEALRDQGRDIKNHSLAHLDLYLQAFEAKVVERGGTVHWARDAAEARAIVLELCQAAGARSVTKSKSMVTEEIGLTAFLESHGMDPIETDLGEYILQISGQPPSHIVGPVVHMTKDEISDLFAKHHGGPRLEEASDLVAEARRILRQRYLSADVGITGANFLVAETGSAITVTNEGNAELTQGLPRTHIVVATLEKIVPTVEDAFTLLRLLARSATGQEFSTYTTVMTGPKREGDLDGPDRFHVVLLDNGRTQMLGNELREMLRCIRCGACMNHCPVYLATGGHAYGWVYPGPMGSVLTPQLHRHRAGLAAAQRLDLLRPLRGGLPGPHPPAQADAALAHRAVRARPGAARCPLGPGRVGLVRQAAPPLSPRHPDRRPQLAPARPPWPAGLGAAGRRLDRDARPAGAAGGHLHEPVARTGPPVSARDAVLARIRLALPRTPEEEAAAEAAVAARLEVHPRNLVPARGQLDREERIQLFARLAMAVATDVRRLATVEEIPAAVSGYLREHNLPQKLVLAPEPLLDRANWDSQPLLRVRRGTAVDADAVGVTLAVAGVAETGTLVLASAAERPTLLAYLPETSVVVVAADWIEPSYEDAWESIRAMPGGVPRSVNFVTGPSRTADIAQQLELGAHGPKRLLVLIVEQLDT